MHHILKTARYGGQLGSYRQLVRSQELVRQQQHRQYHAEELGVYGYKPSPPSTYQGIILFTCITIHQTVQLLLVILIAVQDSLFRLISESWVQNNSSSWST